MEKTRSNGERFFDISASRAKSLYGYAVIGQENSISGKKSMGTARHGLQLIALGGKVYALGGNTAVTNGTTNKCEAYNPKTDAWTAIASMGTPRAYFGAVAYGGRIYVFGG